MNQVEIISELVPTDPQEYKTVNVTISVPGYLLKYIDSLVDQKVQPSRSAFMSQACYDLVFKLLKTNEWFEHLPSQYTQLLKKPPKKEKEEKCQPQP